MNVGVIGLGKLGLPVATTIAFFGKHDVLGYDKNEKRMSKKPQEYKEAGPYGFGDFNDYLVNADTLSFAPLPEVVKNSDIIFIAVQTPHEKEYEGITPLPDTRKDFDYTYLENAVKDVAPYLTKDKILVIISTVLPGTIRKRILPLVPREVPVVYNPFFIAMGTVMRDFLDPEFVLMGSDNRYAMRKLASFYRTINFAPVKMMSFESAELTKVAYNTFISFKIGYVNTLMEICSVFPEADVDDVTDALKCATDRLVSPKYLTAGMGDGGACHPRDNIAMSWLAREYDLSFDLFEAIMKCRENQARRLAEFANSIARKEELPIVLYGYAFKPGTNIPTGSSALLLAQFLDPTYYAEKYDPYIDLGSKGPDYAAVYFLGCNHPNLKNITWPKGSIVIDPFRAVPNQDGVTVYRVGEEGFVW